MTINRPFLRWKNKANSNPKQSQNKPNQTQSFGEGGFKRWVGYGLNSVELAEQSGFGR
jgi:hypothetical protein